jgi:hypothetical protein
MRNFVMPKRHVTFLESETHRMGAKCRENEETGNTFNILALKYDKYEKFGKYRHTSEDNMKLSI